MRPYDKKNFLGKILPVFGNIKVFKWPFFMLYRPTTFAIKGKHTREVLHQIKPGDLLVRSFNHYLDGYTMPGSTFNHVGFYLSEVGEAHLSKLANIQNPSQFNTGKQMVIYAVGNKIFLEDLLDFCRCDGLAIMRFPRQLKPLGKHQIPDILQEYFVNPIKPIEEEVEETNDDEKSKKWKSKLKRKKKDDNKKEKEPVKLDAATKALVKAEKDVANYIAEGKIVEFEKIFKILYRVAIRELNVPYDYDFGIENFHTTGCAEFIYFITKSISWNYGIEPELSHILFKQRPVITPDAIVDSDLEEIWKSDI